MSMYNPNKYSPHSPSDYDPNYYDPNMVKYRDYQYSAGLGGIVQETQTTLLWIALVPIILIGAVVTTVIIVKVGKSVKKKKK